MSEARRQILERARQALGRDDDAEARAQARVAERLQAGAPNLVPARGQRDLEGRIALFTEMAEAVHTEVRRVAAWAEVAGLIGRYLREHNLPQKVTAAPDPLLDRADWASQPLMRVRRGEARDEDVTGVTLAEAGVAETGTLLLASSPERPTLLAFLPETSLLLLPTSEVVASYEEAWQRLRERGDGVPRSLNFITGPSRSADIGQKLELGAHGPRRLCVVLVDEPLG